MQKINSFVEWNISLPSSLNLCKKLMEINDIYTHIYTHTHMNNTRINCILKIGILSSVLQVSSLRFKIPKTFIGSRSEWRSLVGRINSQHPMGGSAKERGTSSSKPRTGIGRTRNCHPRSNERSDKMANRTLLGRDRGETRLLWNVILAC